MDVMVVESSHARRSGSSLATEVGAHTNSLSKGIILKLTMCVLFYFNSLLKNKLDC